ncbi:MAG: AraC family transcriptional regulator, partial [Bacteroidetes bacterium]|nr:AraC family transcriptional regulator [Bacteroidota bacterium]
QSFVCYEMTQPSFDFFWHYHPEYELTYIVSGKGKRLVGNHYESFSEGDLVLIGSNLPHTWISEKNKTQSCKAIVIQFSKEFIEPFVQYEELKDIKNLISKSYKGICFTLSKKNNTASLIKEMVRQSGADRLLLLLQILKTLTEEKITLLNKTAFKSIKRNINEQRINKVFQYVQNNFRHKIYLNKAAAIIHLSESAFCKYFKRISGITFSDHVNEIRIAHACQLLLESDIPISQIAYHSGYESLTYFNRIFLKKKKLSPKNFRELA